MRSEHIRQTWGRVAAAATIVLIGSATGCAATPPETESSTPSTHVSTVYGDLAGREDDGVIRFQNVPYAQPPVSELRLAPPAPVEAWEGELDATAPGAACAQADPATGGVRGSEDCLQLEITIPAAATDEPRPVMVWFHGGGFTEGSAIDYDARRLAEDGDVIVVTVGYRLGALGFMAVPGAADGGTLGLADQQEALRFVEKTADAFGGDPGNVTMFGESAGGSSVCYHLISPSAQGLFDRAIMQSAIRCGAPAPQNAYGLPTGTVPESGEVTVPFTTLDDAQDRTSAVAASLGCSGEGDAVLACLQSLPVESLVAAGAEFTAPAVGGELLPDEPTARLAEVEVPVLAGFTRDESRFYAALAALLGNPYPEGSYEPAIRASFGRYADDVLAEYPRADFADDATAWSAVYTDSTFACPQLHANDLMAERAPVFAYEFADATAPPPIPLLAGAPVTGAAHSTELPYLFDMATQPIDATGQRIPLTAAQESLAADLIRTWSGFARTGEAPVSRWNDGGTSIVFEAGGLAEGDPNEAHHCDFWTDVVPVVD